MSEQRYSVIGLMSGTSLDGLDLAHVELTYGQGTWSFAWGPCETQPYSPDWVERLQAAPRLSGLELSLLDLEYGRFLGSRVRAFAQKYSLTPDLVASHGHTVFHQPERGLTFQLGKGKAIAVACDFPVVYDFRIDDVLLGGQGAPLVPVGDHLLFPQYAVCLNLGGIANLSAETPQGRVAYDICGCNLLLNAVAQGMGLAYDDGGQLARQGELLPSLLAQLDAWDFL
ncbi:MAG: anhydro-N-acetylmuramic acid kinase, partial [Cytophagales bacterium]|nr:anhydro-N-acetylmuramic acid kinase [Cytophagales bacterium]